jgi:two-component system alkaline phosphatase synthesis response regulator PhoP
MKPAILIVEDEEHIAEGIVINMEIEGYRPVLARSGAEALRRFRGGGIDLILLDVMLPDIDGFEVCRTIRREGGQVPILFLTAKGRDEDRIRGLELGGDDYLTKPFNLQELILRVKAILRRREWKPDSSGAALRRLEFGRNWIDFERYEGYGQGERFSLTEKECMILKLLADRRGEVVSRDDILNQVWGYDAFPTSRTIDNFIARFRKRFEPDPESPRYFHTLRGVGYKFTP